MYVGNKVRKTSKSDVWMTPKKTFELLNNEFNFTLDAATESNNPLGVDKFFTEKDNSLIQNWGKETVWLNPPFSMCKEFSQKALDHYNNGGTVVMLVPARLDSKWFQDNVIPYAQVRAMSGRLKFSGKLAAPFSTVICVYSHKRKHIFKRKYKQNLIIQKRGY